MTPRAAMTPRKAVLVGSVISFGTGVLFAGVFGYPLFHWYLTGDIEVISMRTGLTLGHTTYRESPVIFVLQFGQQAAYCALGVLLLVCAIIVPIYHRKRIFRTD
ncbi:MULTISPECIES: hypothetical protein [Bradyrhizobium]|uniref:hypothetical protein n=1 Tax=Bradyrhizobium TaxID=374 RepID=UPI001EDB9C21|nr:hypothetical protein [Bradyrhizobium zhengyangense]MCG2640839.1 hypothetical protein [Bradyrhizobium zhengyangense]